MIKSTTIIYTNSKKEELTVVKRLNLKTSKRSGRIKSDKLKGDTDENQEIRRNATLEMMF